MVRIGHSSISETGTINGRPGDQTGGEVTTRNYYNKNWAYIYRPTTINLAEALVTSMLNACKNDNIGYGQNDRLTLYYECLRLASNGRITPAIIAKVTKKVNCDCSSLVALCCIASGLKVNPDMTTYNQYSALKATKAFEIKAFAAVKDESNLDYGDILQSSGHTAIVIESDHAQKTAEQQGKVTARYPAYSFDSKIAGMYSALVSDFLALRDGAGTKYDILYKLPNRAIVYCYGYYTKDWYYVQYATDKTVYTGFCHKKYLYRM